ncbi:MAG: ABC transporter substrate-binding protein [Chloroflexota bacterium]
MRSIKAGSLFVGALLLAGCGGTATPASSSPAAASPAASKPAAASTAASAPASAASAAAKPAASVSAAPAASGASAAAKPASSGVAGEHVKIAITTGSVTGAGVYIALNRDYFRDVGLDVEIVPFAGGAQMISSVAASQVDIANTDAGAGLLNAISRDLPMRFVGDGSHCDTSHCGTAFTVRKDLLDSGKFKDLKDLKGMAVNFFTPGSTLYQFMNRMLDKAGLKTTNVKVQNISGFPDILPAYSNKALDGSWLIEPLTAQGIDRGLLGQYQTAAELFGPQQNTVIVYSPNFSTQHVDAGKKFMAAYVKGLRDWIDAVDSKKDYDAIISIMTKESSLKDPALFKKIGLPAFDPNGGLLLDPVKSSQQWYVDHGDVKNPIDVDKVYDPQYLAYAIAADGQR